MLTAHATFATVHEFKCDRRLTTLLAKDSLHRHWLSMRRFPVWTKDLRRMKQTAFQTTNRTLWLAGIAAVVVLLAMGMFTRTGVHTVFTALGIGAESTHWRGEPNSPPMVPDSRAAMSAS